MSLSQQPLVIRYNRKGVGFMHIIIIILQIVVGIFFLMTGVKILSGTMSQEFERLGYPKIFNQITGIFNL